MYFLDEKLYFPPVQDAQEDGLLAIGGDLNPERLMLAYQSGIFPWYGPENPILWWSPDPRFVLFTEKFKVSKSLKSKIKKGNYRFSINQAFEQVIKSCQEVKRKHEEGTWITDDMLEAYVQLNKRGQAYSAEIWQGNRLVGGLYGVMLDTMFCGESMFHLESDASKLAFYHFIEFLKTQNIKMIDCQVYTDHLCSLGAEEIPRDEFMDYLK